jgi:short subunit dehydrogenase-like uncharacterized protein
MTSGPSDAWMLYGAYGYTGTLVAEAAVRAGVRPTLAGRNPEAVRALAERLALPWVAFDLDDPAQVAARLAGFRALLLCAGPFSATSAPALEACLRAGVHYLDVTGEIRVFEACQARAAEAKARRVVVLPGVGFDVVPSDCLAATLARALPGANRLELGIATLGGSSRGTARTIVEGLGERGMIREAGRLRPVPLVYRTRTVPFADRPRFAMTIPWGDVSTAFHSTGIPDIEVYMATPPRLARALRLANPVAGLLGSPLVQRWLKAAVDRRVTGPDEASRARGSGQLWGAVQDVAGTRVEATLSTPEGYTLTAATALESTLRVARGEVAPGAHTPATAFGADYIRGFAGCELRLGAPARA